MFKYALFEQHSTLVTYMPLLRANIYNIFTVTLLIIKNETLIVHLYICHQKRWTDIPYIADNIKIRVQNEFSESSYILIFSKTKCKTSYSTHGLYFY